MAETARQAVAGRAELFCGVRQSTAGILARLRKHEQPTGGTLGLAAGGAKDANKFRANIANNYLPIASDITYEGVFYDYYFDTGATSPCTAPSCAESGSGQIAVISSSSPPFGTAEQAPTP